MTTLAPPTAADRLPADAPRPAPPAGWMQYGTLDGFTRHPPQPSPS